MAKVTRRVTRKGAGTLSDLQKRMAAPLMPIAPTVPIAETASTAPRDLGRLQSIIFDLEEVARSAVAHDLTDVQVVALLQMTDSIIKIGHDLAAATRHRKPPAKYPVIVTARDPKKIRKERGL